jgi:hypothetical protein
MPGRDETEIRARHLQRSQRLDSSNLNAGRSREVLAFILAMILAEANGEEFASGKSRRARLQAVVPRSPPPWGKTLSSRGA